MDCYYANFLLSEPYLALLLVDCLALLVLQGGALLLSAGCAGICHGLAHLLRDCPADGSAARLGAVLLRDRLTALLKHGAAFILSDSFHNCGAGFITRGTAATIGSKGCGALLLTVGGEWKMMQSMLNKK